MLTFDFKFDFLDPNRMVLGITYSRALMFNPENDTLDEDDESGIAYILSIGVFFCTLNILMVRV